MRPMGGVLLVKGPLPQVSSTRWSTGVDVSDGEFRRKKSMLSLTPSAGAITSAVKCRYAELDPTMCRLDFWKNQFKLEACGSIDLGAPTTYAVSITPNATHGPTDYHFSLIPKRRKSTSWLSAIRVYEFCAPNRAEFEQWLLAFNLPILSVPSIHDYPLIHALARRDSGGATGASADILGLGDHASVEPVELDLDDLDGDEDEDEDFQEDALSVASCLARKPSAEEKKVQFAEPLALASSSDGGAAELPGQLTSPGGVDHSAAGHGGLDDPSLAGEQLASSGSSQLHLPAPRRLFSDLPSHEDLSSPRSAESMVSPTTCSSVGSARTIRDAVDVDLEYSPSTASPLPPLASASPKSAPPPRRELALSHRPPPLPPPPPPSRESKQEQAQEQSKELLLVKEDQPHSGSCPARQRSADDVVRGGEGTSDGCAEGGGDAHHSSGAISLPLPVPSDSANATRGATRRRSRERLRNGEGGTKITTTSTRRRSPTRSATPTSSRRSSSVSTSSVSTASPSPTPIPRDRFKPLGGSSTSSTPVAAASRSSLSASHRQPRPRAWGTPSHSSNSVLSSSVSGSAPSTPAPRASIGSSMSYVLSRASAVPDTRLLALQRQHSTESALSMGGGGRAATNSPPRRAKPPSTATPSSRRKEEERSLRQAVAMAERMPSLDILEVLTCELRASNRWLRIRSRGTRMASSSVEVLGMAQYALRRLLSYLLPGESNSDKRVLLELKAFMGEVHVKSWQPSVPLVRWMDSETQTRNRRVMVRDGHVVGLNLFCSSLCLDLELFGQLTDRLPHLSRLNVAGNPYLSGSIADFASSPSRNRLAVFGVLHDLMLSCNFEERVDQSSAQHHRALLHGHMDTARRLLRELLKQLFPGPEHEDKRVLLELSTHVTKDHMQSFQRGYWDPTVPLAEWTHIRLDPSATRVEELKCEGQVLMDTGGLIRTVRRLPKLLVLSCANSADRLTGNIRHFVPLVDSLQELDLTHCSGVTGNLHDCRELRRISKLKLKGTRVQGIGQ